MPKAVSSSWQNSSTFACLCDGSLCQSLSNSRFRGLRKIQVWTQLREFHWHFADVQEHQTDVLVAAKWSLSGEHLEDNDAQRIDIASDVELKSLALLGAHVGRTTSYSLRLIRTGSLTGVSATPKSRSLTKSSPDSVDCNMIFSGFRSRWMMPCL